MIKKKLFAGISIFISLILFLIFLAVNTDTATITTTVIIGGSNNEALLVIVKETDLDSAETVTSDYFDASYWDLSLTSVKAQVKIDGGNDSAVIIVLGRYDADNTDKVVDSIATNKTTFHETSLSPSGLTFRYLAIQFKGIDCSNATALCYLYRVQSDGLKANMLYPLSPGQGIANLRFKT